MMKAFVTGATGFLGSSLVKQIAARYQTIYLLVRPQSLKRAREIFHEISNIILVEGDIVEDELIFEVSLKNKIANEVEIIIHCAASYNLRLNYRESYMSNVFGTQNLCFWANDFKKLKYFHYVSTIAVIGNRDGKVEEEQLDTLAKFSNGYGATKMSAELLFRKAQVAGAKKRIYRPGIIIGDSQTGEFTKADGPYYLLKAIRKLTSAAPYLKALPAYPFTYKKGVSLPFIPIDVVVNWLSTMVADPIAAHDLRTYHLVDNNPIEIETFMKDCLSFYGLKNDLKPVQKREVYRTLLKVLGLPPVLLDFMYNDIQYLTNQREEDFPQLDAVPYESYKHNFLRGAEQYFQREV